MDALRDSNARFNKDDDNDNNNFNFGNAPDRSDEGGVSGGSYGGPRRRKSKRPWRTKGPIPHHSPPPSKYDDHSTAVPYVPVPPPQPEVFRPILPPRFDVKKCLKPPKLNKNDFLKPFIPDVEMDDDDYPSLPQDLPPAGPKKFETDFQRAKASLIDKKNNVIEMIPKVKHERTPSPTLSELSFAIPNFKDFEKNEVTTDINKVFPEIKKEVTPNAKVKELDIVTDFPDYEDIFRYFDDNETEHKSVQFFHGSEKSDFEKRVISLGISENSRDFLNFLMSATCAQIMEDNKLKIHIEASNIYFDKYDTNESIFGFFQSQEDDAKIFIDYDIFYNGSYQKYFDDYIVGRTQDIDDTLDIFTNRNSKYLLYRYNDILLDKLVPLIKIHHTNVLKDSIAIQISQQKNWQYFAEKLMDIAWNNKIGDTLYMAAETNLMKNYLLNLTVLEKTYQEIYDKIVASFAVVV